MSLPRILIIKTGSTLPEVSQSHGDYEDWLAASLEDGASRCLVVDARDPLPDLSRAELQRTFAREGADPSHKASPSDGARRGAKAWPSNGARRDGKASASDGAEPGSVGGVILTGSPSSVRDEDPWMQRLVRWSFETAAAGTPVLAICFGHQLLGEALGGRVERLPHGPEMGAVEIQLTPEGREDPLFTGLPDTLVVNQTHFDGLVQPPPPGRAVRLAGNDHCPWQAYRVGPNIRGVQFHPELRDDTVADLLARRGIEGVVRPSEHGATVLRNWDRAFVRRGRIADAEEHHPAESI